MNGRTFLGIVIPPDSPPYLSTLSEETPHRVQDLISLEKPEATLWVREKSGTVNETASFLLAGHSDKREVVYGQAFLSGPFNWVALNFESVPPAYIFELVK